MAPLTIEHVSVYMIEDAATVRLILSPFAFVASPVRPRLKSEAMPISAQPLARVNRSILKSVLAIFHLERTALFFNVT